MATDAQPDQVLGSYSITRFDVEDGKAAQGAVPGTELSALDHLTVVGITELLLGNVPSDLRAGDEPVGKEWKIHMGGVHWIVIKRTA